MQRRTSGRLYGSIHSTGAEVNNRALKRLIEREHLVSKGFRRGATRFRVGLLSGLIDFGACRGMRLIVHFYSQDHIGNRNRDWPGRGADDLHIQCDDTRFPAKQKIDDVFQREADDVLQTARCRNREFYIFGDKHAFWSAAQTCGMQTNPIHGVTNEG